MNVVKLAARNVIRSWHRTVVITLAMAFAGFIMILFASLMEGMLRASERNAVTMDVADIQIHAHGYRDDPDLYTRIDNPDTIVTALREAGFPAAPRLYAFALAASGSASAGVHLRGIDVALEQNVTQIHRHIMVGKWLEPDDPHGVVIGKKLARTLGTAIGGEVVIVGQASDGSMANDLYHVRGILKSVGDEIDRGAFFMAERAFREIMTLYEGAHEIAVMRPGRQGDLDIATEKVAELAPRYEVLNWRQLRPLIARILDMGDTQLIVMILITYVAVAMVVLNAMLMGVFERIHEFGIMKAIGVTPRQIVMLIYAETLLQTVCASFLALTAGWFVAGHFQRHGIDLSRTAGGASFGGVAIDPIWYAHVTTEALMMPIIFLIVIAMLAVIYPAAKAALIEPVKAIHYR